MKPETTASNCRNFLTVSAGALMAAPLMAHAKTTVRARTSTAISLPRLPYPVAAMSHIRQLSRMGSKK